MIKITEDQIEGLQAAVNAGYPSGADSTVLFNLIEQREEMIHILKEVESNGVC